MTPMAVPIYIVDSHGDALQYWSDTHKGKPRTVFHLDSHADMMTNWSNQLWTNPGPDWKPPTREALVHRVASQVDLANFQPSAIFQGLLDSIVWLRSDFPLGQYNGPAPGHYRRILGMPDYSVPGSTPDPIIGDGARPLLTFFHVSGESFAEYGEISVEGTQRHAKGRYLGIPLERNTSWDGCWECTRPVVSELSREFDHSVVTLDQLLAPSGEALKQISQRLRIGQGSGEWILDIDLDFFATYSPLLAYVIRRHGWTDQSEAEAFASWAVPLGRICSHALEEATRHTLFHPEYQPYTVREIIRLPFSQEGQHVCPSSQDILRKFRSINDRCEIPQNVLSVLSDIVRNLTQQQRLQWATIDPEDWWWIMQSQGPHHYSTPQEISLQVKSLEAIFSQWSHHPPSLVTIARSMDMYMPEGASDIAEWEVLLLIRRIWPLSSDHPLPHELRECGVEDINAMLRDVVLYPTTRPVPGKQPEPMCFRPWPFENSPLPCRATDSSADLFLTSGAYATASTQIFQHVSHQELATNEPLGTWGKAKFSDDTLCFEVVD